MSGDLAFRVEVDGKDYTRFVESISNSFVLDEPDSTSSSFKIKSDSAQENIALLREFIAHANKQRPAKVYIRGYYEPKQKLRVAGYTKSISGANPYTGFTVLLTMTNQITDTPKEDTANSEPYIDLTVTDIVKRLIKTYGYTEGKIDQFDARMASFYPGNRTFIESIKTLADSVGAIISIDLAPTQIDGRGRIQIDGIFSNPDVAEVKGVYDSRTIKLINPAVGDDTANTNRYASDATYDEDAMRNLTPIPLDFSGPIKFGPGQSVVRGGKVAAPVYGLDDTTGFYYGADNAFKSKQQREYEEMIKRDIDPYAMDTIRGATIKAYVKDDGKTIVQLVDIVDSTGKVLTVPVDVAAATLKSRKTVSFIKSNESSGMLGQTGLILTMKPGDLQYPFVRVKEIGGFEYIPAISDEQNAPSPAATDGTAGASRKDFVATELKISPQDDMTIKDIVNDPNYSGAFREVQYDGKTYYVAYDPESIKKNLQTGEFEPEDSGRAKGQQLRNITRDEFNSLSPNIVYELFQKRRASVLASSQDDFIKTYYPDLAKRLAANELEKDDSTASANAILLNEERNRILDAEIANNPYYDDGKKYGNEVNEATREYTNTQYLPPVFTGEEELRAILPLQRNETGGANASYHGLYVGGDQVGQRQDGRSPLMRANTLMFNRTTGQSVVGGNLAKENWPFSMSIQIDSAVEVNTGMQISADETFGPFMGPYTIKSISESLSPSSLSMTLELQTQSYMTGYGRAMNSAQSNGGNDTETSAAGAGVNSATPLPNDPSRPNSTNPGERLVQWAMQGLSAGWSESEPGFCNAFIRAVSENAYGVRSSRRSGGDFSGLYGASAAQLDRNARSMGLSSPYNYSKLRKGTIIIIGYGSNGYGHVGMYDGNGNVIENSWRKGMNGDGRLITPLHVFLRETPTSIIDPEDFDRWARSRGGR